MRARVEMALAALVVGLLFLLPPSASSAGSSPSNEGAHLAEAASPPPAPPTPLPTPGVGNAGATGGSWPVYLGSPERTGANFQERTLAPSNISLLQLEWRVDSANGSIFSSPVVVNGTVYVGNGAGYELAVRASSGAVLWAAYLGRDATCDEYGGPSYGTLSSPELWNGTLYLAGGNQEWYALNASTGDVEWKADLLAEPSLADHCDYSSALLYRGAGYIALSADPEVYSSSGELVEVNLSGNHSVLHNFSVEPAGSYGGSIDGTPALDPAANLIWFTTGWGYGAYGSNPNASALTSSVIAVNATTLRLVGGWQVAGGYASLNAPILITDPNGRSLVVVSNEEGMTYALNRSNVSRSGTWGPVWSALTGYAYSSAPAYPTSAYDGSTLFIVGGDVYGADGAWMPYAVVALNPVTGAFVWNHTSPDSIEGGLAYANGLVMDATEEALEVLSATNGSRLASYRVSLSGSIEDAPAVADGRIYFGTAASGYGSELGSVYSLGIPLASADVEVNRTSGTAPLPVQFRARVAGGEPPYSFEWQFSDGTNSTLPTLDHVFAYAAFYTIELSVHDAAGNARYWNSSLSVTPAIPLPPVFRVFAVATSQIGAAPFHVQFTATENNGTDPPYAFQWAFGDGSPPEAGAIVDHTFLSPGLFEVEVTAMEWNGTVATASVGIRVVTPLTGSDSVTPIAGTAPITVDFVGMGQGGLPPYSYAWNFGDASPPASAADLTHTYDNGGTYMAELTVTDAVGQLWTQSTNLDLVTPAIPLWVNASKVAQSYSCSTGTGLVDLSATATGGVSPITFQWGLSNGAPPLVGQSVRLPYSTFGPIDVTVSATDPAGATASRSLVIPIASTACPHPYSGVEPPSGVVVAVSPWGSPMLVGLAALILLVDFARRRRQAPKHTAR